MELWIGSGGLGLTLAGAVILALADAWFSRAVLVYLDAVEMNLTKLVESLRGDGQDVALTQVDLKRDRGQDRARAAKFVGWVAFALGIGLQIVALLVAAVARHAA